MLRSRDDDYARLQNLDIKSYLMNRRLDPSVCYSGRIDGEVHHAMLEFERERVEFCLKVLHKQQLELCQAKILVDAVWPFMSGQLPIWRAFWQKFGQNVFSGRDPPRFTCFDLPDIDMRDEQQEQLLATVEAQPVPPLLLQHVVEHQQQPQL